jgi:peptidylprolyl isomerase
MAVIVLCGLVLVAACDKKNEWTTESGLQVIELAEGEGASPREGDIISLEFTAWYLGGEEFDSTDRLGHPRKFRLGRDKLLPGLEEGVSTMRRGCKRILILPPELAFGPEGRPGVVPPDAWVKFEVEMVDIQPGPPPPLPWDDAGMEYYTTKSGLQFVDFLTGDGEFPELGSTVVVHYSGYLDDATLFDSTYLRGHPIEFELTQDYLIPGFVEGLLTMRAGGMRKLVIPPFLGYGDDGYGKAVPPNATLIYDVELLEVK